MAYPTTVYTTANATPAASTECDWRQGSGGGQHWVIADTIEHICRLAIVISTMGSGTAFTAIAAPTTVYTQTP